MAELNPDVAEWSGTLKTNAILADIADILMMINANLISIGSRKPAKRPKPYPRPKKREADDERHFGSGGLPPEQLHRWIEEKRAQHATGSTSDNSGHPNA